SRAGEDSVAALRRRPVAWERAPDRQAGDVHLPWFNPLPGEEPQRDPQHRAEAERESARTIHQQGADLAQGEQASTRPGAAGTSGQNAQRLLPVLRIAAVLHTLIRRPSPRPRYVGVGVAASQPESQTTLRLGDAAPKT